MCHGVGRDKQAQQGVGASQPLGFQGRGEQHLGKPEEVWTKREEILTKSCDLRWRKADIAQRNARGLPKPQSYLLGGGPFVAQASLAR